MAALRKVFWLSNPHGSVARKADCALTGPIRLSISEMADKRLFSLSPRFVPSERYAVWVNVLCSLTVSQ